MPAKNFEMSSISIMILLPLLFAQALAHVCDEVIVCQTCLVTEHCGLVIKDYDTVTELRCVANVTQQQEEDVLVITGGISNVNLASQICTYVQ